MKAWKWLIVSLVAGCLALCLGACTQAESADAAAQREADQAAAQQQAVDDAKAQGEAAGKEAGKAEGKAEGIEEGKAAGIEEGKAAGYEEGKAAAQKDAADEREKAANTWTVVPFEKGKIEYNGLGDLIVTLVEHPSTGYRWTQSVGGTGLAYQGERTLAPEQVAVSEPDPDMATVLDSTAGEHIFTYAGADDGNGIITLLCSSTGTEDETSLKFTINVITAKDGIVTNASVKQEQVSGPRKVTVPDLTGLTTQQTEDALLSLNLVPMAADPQVNTSVAPGLCWQQNYAPGSVVKEGTAVWYRIALGENVVQVPDVEGMDQYTAASVLQNAGFGVDVNTMYSDSVPYNCVIVSNPYEYVKCVAGTTVVIYVSQGPTPPKGGTVLVPNVRTLTLQQAQTVIQSAGLNCRYVGPDDGTVVAQDIAGGTEVRLGTTVTLTLDQIYY